MIAIAENGNHKDYFSKLLSRAMRWLLANDRNTFLSGQSSPSGRLNIFQWSRKVCWMGHRSVCLCSDAKCMWKTSRGLGPSGWGKRVSKIQAARGLTDVFKQQVSSGVVLSIRKGHTLPSREQMIWARRPYTQQSWGDRKACWHNCKRNVMYSQNWLYVCMFNLSQPYTHVPHGEEHFQHVLIWGAEVELEIHKRASFCPLRNTHLSSGLCMCAWNALCSSLHHPHCCDVANLLWVKHQQFSCLMELLQSSAVLE